MIGVATKSDLDALERRLRAANGAKATPRRGHEAGVKKTAARSGAREEDRRRRRPKKPAAKKAAAKTAALE